MARKQRRIFTEEQKRRAVDEYVSGRKTASTVASELNVSANLIYRWKVELDEASKGARVDELVSEGQSLESARRIQQLEEEIEAYQKKVAELTVMNDLLKKLPPLKSSASESELSGLIATTKKSARRRKR